MLKEGSVDTPTLPPDELMAAQQEDPTIARVLRFMQIRRRPTYQEIQNEPAIVRQLLHEWDKLLIAEDGIIVWIQKSNGLTKTVLQKSL